MTKEIIEHQRKPSKSEGFVPWSQLVKMIDDLARHPEVLRYKVEQESIRRLVEEKRAEDAKTPLAGKISGKDFTSRLGISLTSRRNTMKPFNHVFGDHFLGIHGKSVGLRHDSCDTNPWLHDTRPNGSFIYHRVSTIQVVKFATDHVMAEFEIIHQGSSQVNSLQGPHVLNEVRGYGELSCQELGEIFQRAGLTHLLTSL